MVLSPWSPAKFPEFRREFPLSLIILHRLQAKIPSILHNFIQGSIPVITIPSFIHKFLQGLFLNSLKKSCRRFRDSTDSFYLILHILGNTRKNFINSPGSSQEFINAYFRDYYRIFFRYSSRIFLQNDQINFLDISLEASLDE